MELHQWFKKNSTPSLSPMEAMRLLEVANGLMEKIEKESNAKILKELAAYRDALLNTASYSAKHQKAVIERFEELVRK